MKDSIFLNHEKNKTQNFRQNKDLNFLLGLLKDKLYPVQKSIEKDIAQPNHPLLFIVGAPRSGTTILTQWIASLGSHAYGSNFLTRFAYAPYIGALIQRLLFEEKFDFHGDLQDIKSEISLESNLGKSKGALGVNEFQHFFRNYMNNFDPEFLSKDEFSKVQIDSLLAGFASMEAVFEKPFCTKAFMLQYNIMQLYEKYKNIIYLHTVREPIYNMQSIYVARKKYFNSTKIWLGPKPKEFLELSKMDEFHQIAGQVYFTNKSISESFDKLPVSNTITIQYEDFCTDPMAAYNKLVSKYRMCNYNLTAKYKGISSFKNKNVLILDKPLMGKLENAYNYFLKNNGTNQ